MDALQDKIGCKGADTKRKGESISAIPIKRTRADAPSIPDKATVGGVPSWDVPTTALVTSMSWAPATFVGDGWSVGASALDGDCRCGLTLALRVNTKLGTLSLSEGILLPRVHDELGSSQQTLQRRLCRIGRILL